MPRKLCLACFWFASLFLPFRSLAISGISCTANVTGSIGVPLTVLTSCTTISVFVNPNINFVSGTPMPPGLLITKSSSSGGNATWQVTGTATSGGSGTAVYTFTDSNPGSVSMTVNYSILAPVVPNATLSQATVNRPLPVTNFSATGGTETGFTFVIISGSLPAGVSLSSSGALTGTPGTTGSFPFTVRAIDSSSNSGSASFALIVNPAAAFPVFTTLSRTVSQTYSSNYAATGGTSPLSYMVTAGTLPPGATLHPTSGMLSGSVSSAASGSFELTVTDANGGTAATTIPFTVSPLPAISLSTPNGSVGSLWSQTISFTGALSSVVLGGGSLPSGLVLGAGGTIISGTPTTTGTFNFSLAGIDTNGVSASAAFSIVIAGPLASGTTSLPPANLGSAYSQSLLASGGNSPYTFTVTAGALPAGLTLSSVGLLSGTPTAAGSFAFSVTINDVASATVVQPLSLTVSAPPLQFSTVSLPSGTATVAYSAAIAAAGGAGGLSYFLHSGGLPPGITLSSNGLLSGTPSSPGSYSFTVRVEDSFTNSATRGFTVNIVSPVSITTPTQLPSATVGAFSQIPITVSGGTAPLLWQVTGTLPPGLNLTQGILSGSPTTAGLFHFSISVTDSLGASAQSSFSQTVNPPLTFISSSWSGSFPRLSLLDQAVSAGGGTPPLTWALVEGALPPGVVLESATGRLRGLLSTVGRFRFTVRILDSLGASITRSLEITVGERPVFGTDLPAATRGQRYSTLVPVTNDFALIEWTVGSPPATFPPGLSLSGQEISGIPTVTGDYDFELNVRDAAGSSAVGRFRFRVNDPLSIVMLSAPVEVPLGQPFSWQVPLRGGSAPFRYQLLNGVFPAGLVWDEFRGSVRGTAVSAGLSGLTLGVIDSNAASTHALFQFRVRPSTPLTLHSDGLRSPVPTGESFRASLAPSGGTAPYQVGISEGLLPQGLSLNGLSIEGRPVSAGPFDVTFTVSDAAGGNARLRWTGRVGSLEFSVSPPSLSFFAVERSLIGLSHLLRISGADAASPVRLRPSAPWVRLSRSQLNSPGIVEVTVDSFGLPVGTSNAEIVAEQGSRTIAVPVSLDHFADNPVDWWTTLTPLPGGHHLALLLGNAVRIPFSATLDSAELRLNQSQGEVSAPESFPLLLERRMNVPAYGQLTLTNQSGDAILNETLSLPAVPAIESSSPLVRLNASLTDVSSTSVPLVLRSTNRQPLVLSATSSQAWIEIRELTRTPQRDLLFLIAARPAGLANGHYTAELFFWDSAGRLASRIPVEFEINPKPAAVTLSSHSFSLSRQLPAAVLTLLNPGADPISFSISLPGHSLSASPAAASIGGGQSLDIRLSAAEAALLSWSRQIVTIAFSNGQMELVEIDFTAPLDSRGRCPLQSPVLRFLHPGPAPLATAGKPMPLRFAVNNPCGQPLGGSAFVLRAPGEAPVALFPGPDQSWYGIWTPAAPAHSLLIEAIWLDLATRTTASRWMSTSILNPSP